MGLVSLPNHTSCFPLNTKCHEFAFLVIGNGNAMGLLEGLILDGLCPALNPWVLLPEHAHLNARALFMAEADEKSLCTERLLGILHIILPRLTPKSPWAAR